MSGSISPASSPATSLLSPVSDGARPAAPSGASGSGASVSGSSSSGGGSAASSSTTSSVTTNADGSVTTTVTDSSGNVVSVNTAGGDSDNGSGSPDGAPGSRLSVQA